MQLHELERGTRFRLVRTSGEREHPLYHREFVSGEVLTFSHIENGEAAP